MAHVFPIEINGVRLYINPRQLQVQKNLLSAQADTFAGRVYQIWWAQPETITISGVVFGDFAYQQLLKLKRDYESKKKSTLRYKSTSYEGFITRFDVTYTSENPRQWSYNLTFNLLQGQHFQVEDFTITPERMPFWGRALLAVPAAIETFGERVSRFIERTFFSGMPVSGREIIPKEVWRDISSKLGL